MAETTTYLALEALVRFQLGRKRNARLLADNKGGNYDFGLEATDSEYVEGPGAGDPALSNNRSYEIDGNYLDPLKIIPTIQEFWVTLVTTITTIKILRCLSLPFPSLNIIMAMILITTIFLTLILMATRSRKASCAV